MYGLPDSIIVGSIKKFSNLMPGTSPFSGQSGSSGAGATGFSFGFKGVVLYPGALDFMLNNPQGDVGKYLRKRGRWIVAAAQRQVGVQTGALRQSIHSRSLRDARSQYLWVGSEQSHALMHHEGTRPHEIVPREAPVLRFTAGSRIIYTRHVMHPGTRPNKYLSDQLYLVKI